MCDLYREGFEAMEPRPPKTPVSSPLHILLTPFICNLRSTADTYHPGWNHTYLSDDDSIHSRICTVAHTSIRDHPSK